MPTFNHTASRIINLFNHDLTRYDRQEIRQLFATVRSSGNADELALQVADTLEHRVLEYERPYCTEKQAMALAYVIDGCQ